jgi:hypothetical protein
MNEVESSGDALRFTFVLNLCWAICMLLAFIALVIGGSNLPRVVLLVLATAYVWLALQARLRKPWAVGVSICIAVALMFRWLPMVVVNFLMFYAEDPLYLDSPATILVVITYAVLFALPATVLVLAYGLQWRSLARIFQLPRRASDGA